MTFLPFSESSKIWEPLAQDLRARVCRKRADSVAFDPWELAPLVGLRVVDCDFQGLSEEESEYLSGTASGDWSGGVYPVPLPDGSRLCMLNPGHPYRRNKITLMEEICHCHLNHSPTALITKNGGKYRDFNKTQEMDAYGVGAAVLLPWSLFFSRLNTGVSVDDISEEFDVTPQLVNYRIKICGATALYRKRRQGKTEFLRIPLQ